ncbi:hypothetical protein EDB86DRAFT_2826659 [Lactarius hatsudake]|nr:hypothetical protein EDB86DRAFT_2826659 [Lactarius hatsudake]
MSSISPCAIPYPWGLKDADMLSPQERTFATHSRAVGTAIQLQFGSVLHRRRPRGSPYDEACEAQFSPLGPEATSVTDAQKAEPPKHGNAFGGKQYGCGPCKITFKRLQDITRHVRDIHDPPRQCPLCHYQWTRAYKIKAHLLKAHSDELCPAVTAGIHALRGHDVVKFIETYELLRSFETPDIVKSLSKVIL